MPLNFSGVLSALSPALTVASQAAGGYEQGKQQGSQLMRAMQLQDEARQRDIDTTSAQLDRMGYGMGKAPTTDAVSVGGPDGAPVSIPGRYSQVTPTLYRDSTRTPEAIAGRDEERKATLAERLAEAKANAQPPKPWAPTSKQEYLEVHPPRQPATPKDPTPHYSAVPGVDPATGKPTVYRLNTLTGEMSSSGVEKPASAGGNSAQSQLMQARLATAAQQSLPAHKQMTAYEDKVLAGQAQFTTADAMLARQMLSGGGFSGPSSERALNAKNPELAAYVRSAKAISAAERLISPRGGSNALTGTETFLSGAGPGATPQLIEQARGYRRAFMQGLQGHGASAAPSAGTGDVDLGGGGDSHPSFQVRVQQLKQQGLDPAAAQAQLRKEGYQW